jgi:hypothetical protein
VRPKLDLAGVKAVTLSEYAARFAFGGAVSIVTMLVTRAYGPVIGGLFLAFPSDYPREAPRRAREGGRRCSRRTDRVRGHGRLRARRVGYGARLASWRYARGGCRGLVHRQLRSLGLPLCSRAPAR